MRHTRLAKKLCNGFIGEPLDASAAYAEAAADFGIDMQADPTDMVIQGFRAHVGGIWVGGSAELTTAFLMFRPNALNRALHAEDYSFTIALADIASVEYERALLTDIVVVTTATGRFKLRCFGARRFRDLIAGAAVRAKATAQVVEA